MMISPPTRRAFLMGAAALSLPLPVRAQAYQPGGTLSVVKFDRPGDASVNSYILIGPRTQVILDCQRTAVEARQLVAMARGLDLPVEAIVLSHEHPDHVGGAQVVRDAFPDAALLASETTHAAIRRDGAAMMAEMKRFFGPVMPDAVPIPTRILRPGERLRLADVEWQVDQLGPCEAAGMTMLHAEAQGILFAADLVGNRVTPWLVDGHTTAWLGELAAARQRYASVDLALPGHGSAAPMVALIDEQRAYLESFRAEVMATIGTAKPTPEALSAIRSKTESRYPGYPKVAPPPDLIERNANAVAAELARR
ncbi:MULTISPECIES: MBL fold metallo-hydrolase [Hyphomicrobiales]|jgi:glyoxylase-like metal-dependent hydrolase (beta-lactamase superfamily II)|uniref:MBL fold metallo-hydrolase n=1 Tax=Methylobacterium sp. CCH7-A2 TaxID=1768789 RepID=UPI00082B3F91|nr:MULTISPECIES: MBL fold metallo-hydrolase [Hyphomicrobiales]